MATAKQDMGERGEKLVVKHCCCPRCKCHGYTLRRLPPNFKCADLICDFCGFLAQVKAKSTKDTGFLPNKIIGAAWSVQKERMDSGIYFPLYIVLVNTSSDYAIYYLSADLQDPQMFVPRKPLSKNAKRAGWQGFTYDLTLINKSAVVRLK